LHFSSSSSTRARVLESPRRLTIRAGTPGLRQRPTAPGARIQCALIQRGRPLVSLPYRNASSCPHIIRPAQVICAIAFLRPSLSTTSPNDKKPSPPRHRRLDCVSSSGGVCHGDPGDRVLIVSIRSSSSSRSNRRPARQMWKERGPANYTSLSRQRSDAFGPRDKSLGACCSWFWCLLGVASPPFYGLDCGRRPELPFHRAAGDFSVCGMDGWGYAHAS